MRTSSSDMEASCPETGRNPSTANPSALRLAAAKAYACAIRATALPAESGGVAPTARPAHMSANSGRPEMTIQLASEVAACPPTSGSRSSSCACQAASKRPSAPGEPVSTPSSPVSASRRALATWQEARARAAAEVLAESRWNPAESKNRRSRSSPAAESKAACSIAQAEASASPTAALARAEASSSFASVSCGPTDAATRWASRGRPVPSSAARARSLRRFVGLRSA